MSFTDVMYGPLGQVNNQFQNNLGQNAAMNQGQQAAMAQQQQAMAAQQAQLAALYGAQGFGGQTAYYAGQGADYGRATGGFGGYGGMNDPMSPVGGYNAIDQNDPSNIALYYKLMGIPQPGGGGGYTPQMPPFQMPQPQSQADPQVDWSAYFNQVSAPQSPYANNSGGLATLPGGGINPNDPGNIALYYQLMGMGGGGIPAAAPSPQATLGYDPSTLYQNAMGYPGGGVSSYYNPATYGSFGMGIPAQTGTGGLAMRNGAIDQQDPGNIALYYQMMGGGSPMMAQGGDTSWLGAGGANNSYNPFGQINSGQVGQYDPFGGYQAAPDFNSRFGSFPGMPYGQGYFDQTFGAANSQPQAYNPFMGGYPGAMASDNMANQQQMIQDLYRTLGIIDNAGEFNRGDGAYNPSGNTLRSGDYHPSPFVNLPGS